MRPAPFFSVCLFAACTGGSGDDADTGDLNGACYPNQTCNGNLICDDGVCRDDNSGPDGGPIPDAAPANDGAAFACNDDSEIEPNDIIADATFSGIPTFQSEIRFVGLAICPSGDVDLFQFNVETNPVDAQVDVEYSQAQGELEVRILNSAGISLVVGSPALGDPNLLRAEIPNLPLGIYFAEIRGANQSVENNYNLEIVTVD